MTERYGACPFEIGLWKKGFRPEKGKRFAGGFS